MKKVKADFMTAYRAYERGREIVNQDGEKIAFFDTIKEVVKIERKGRLVFIKAHKCDLFIIVPPRATIFPTN